MLLLAQLLNTPGKTVPVAVDAKGRLIVAGADDSILVDDTTTAGYTYFCYAPPGTPTSAPAWKIKRMDSAGCVTWADSDNRYDNVADNRAALTYGY